MDDALLKDDDAQVRLAAFLALSETPTQTDAGKAIFAALKEPRNATDRWLPDAITAAAARHDTAFLKAVLTSASTELDASERRVITVVTQHYAERAPVDSIVDTLLDLKGATPVLAEVVLEGLLEGWPNDAAPAH